MGLTVIDLELVRAVNELRAAVLSGRVTRLVAVTDDGAILTGRYATDHQAASSALMAAAVNLRLGNGTASRSENLVIPLQANSRLTVASARD